MIQAYLSLRWYSRADLHSSIVLLLCSTITNREIDQYIKGTPKENLFSFGMKDTVCNQEGYDNTNWICGIRPIDSSAVLSNSLGRSFNIIILPLLSPNVVHAL